MWLWDVNKRVNCCHKNTRTGLQSGTQRVSRKDVCVRNLLEVAIIALGCTCFGFFSFKQLSETFVKIKYTKVCLPHTAERKGATLGKMWVKKIIIQLSTATLDESQLFQHNICSQTCERRSSPYWWWPRVLPIGFLFVSNLCVNLSGFTKCDLQTVFGEVLK